MKNRVIAVNLAVAQDMCGVEAFNAPGIPNGQEKTEGSSDFIFYHSRRCGCRGKAAFLRIAIAGAVLEKRAQDGRGVLRAVEVERIGGRFRS